MSLVVALARLQHAFLVWMICAINHQDTMTSSNWPKDDDVDTLPEMSKAAFWGSSVASTLHYLLCKEIKDKVINKTKVHSYFLTLPDFLFVPGEAHARCIRVPVASQQYATTRSRRFVGELGQLATGPSTGCGPLSQVWKRQAAKNVGLLGGTLRETNRKIWKEIQHKGAKCLHHGVSLI